MYTSKKDNPFYKIIHYGLEYLGRYYSSYRGFVIDNNPKNDPQDWGRIKVFCPTINSKNTEGVWAFAKGQSSGKDHGVQILPSKGDMVWIEFSQGDLRYPIWQHGHYGKGQRPAEFDNPSVYGIKTPKGNIITIDDTETLVKVLLKSGEYIQLTEDLISIDSKTIKLGVDANESLVLGDSLKTLLTNIMTLVNNINDQIILHTHPSPGTPAANAGVFTQYKSDIVKINTDLEKILSEKVKVE